MNLMARRAAIMNIVPPNGFVDGVYNNFTVSDGNYFVETTKGTTWATTFIPLLRPISINAGGAFVFQFVGQPLGGWQDWYVCTAPEYAARIDVGYANTRPNYTSKTKTFDEDTILTHLLFVSRGEVDGTAEFQIEFYVNDKKVV